MDTGVGRGEAMHNRDSDQTWGFTVRSGFRSFDAIMLLVALAPSSEVAEK